MVRTRRRCVLVVACGFAAAQWIVYIFYSMSSQASHDLTQEETLGIFARDVHRYINGSARLTLRQHRGEKPENDGQFRNNSTKFRVFVYDLPTEFNIDLMACVNRKYSCFITKNAGYGTEWMKDSYMTILNTWQFSLEVLLHNKFLSSPYRTHNPDEADIFYVPYYSALACFCYWSNVTACSNNINRMFQFLKKSKYFQDGRPHVMAVSKIEREQASLSCPTLRHDLANKIDSIGIEEESNPGIRHDYLHVRSHMFVVPYPAYGHFWPNITVKDVGKLMTENKRTVFILLASSQRRSNLFRAKILDQIKVKVKAKFDYKEAELDQEKSKYSGYDRESMLYETNECHDHRFLINWMRHSVFCLQPPGDSPTRKSFYDSIISGCIPVLFSNPYHVRYPFETKLNYSRFTVTLDSSAVEGGESVVEMLKSIPNDQIKTLQEKLREVAVFLQYSYPPSDSVVDATEFLIEEMTDWYKRKLKADKRHKRRHTRTD